MDSAGKDVSPEREKNHSEEETTTNGEEWKKK
jgi:hypothetical protein